MIIHEKDGWRNEDSEGPYTDTLRTFYDWPTDTLYKILRESPVTDKKFKVIYPGCTESISFDSIEACKLFVKNLINQRKQRESTI